MVRKVTARIQKVNSKTQIRKFAPVRTTKAYGSSEIWLHSFLSLALDGSKQLASRFGHFTTEEITPGKIEFEAGWVPQPVRKYWEINLLSVPGIETQLLCYPAHNLVTILTAISRIPHLTIIHDK